MIESIHSICLCDIVLLVEIYKIVIAALVWSLDYATKSYVCFCVADKYPYLNYNHFSHNQKIIVAYATFSLANLFGCTKLFRLFLIIIWLIQVKDGKLLDEMAVSFTGLANKVGQWGQTSAMLHRPRTSLLSKQHGLHHTHTHTLGCHHHSLAPCTVCVCVRLCSHFIPFLPFTPIRRCNTSRLTHTLEMLLAFFLSSLSFSA